MIPTVIIVNNLNASNFLDNSIVLKGWQKYQQFIVLYVVLKSCKKKL